MYKIKITFIGTLEFPKDHAEIQKQILISKSLIYTGAKVSLIFLSRNA